MSKMNIRKAGILGLVPKNMCIRPSICRVKKVALLEWGKKSGRDVTAQINKLSKYENIAHIVTRCFNKHGYGKTTRNLLARLGI